MEYLFICLTAFFASGLTLFSGFGLGTLLLPVFAVFFPLDISIALTAIVHLLNNLFKLGLLGRHADKEAVLKFGLPSLAAAIAGAFCLTFLVKLSPLTSYNLGNKEYYIEPVRLIIALLMIIFALIDIFPQVLKLSLDRRHFIAGGLLSGFFGGLSGHQGALRSAFLVKSGLHKQSFIATGVAIAVLTDLSRLTVYSAILFKMAGNLDYILLLSATVSAFAGAFFGNRLMKKITIKTIQAIVGIMLIILAAGIGLGIF